MTYFSHRWMREAAGTWALVRFRIRRFKVLDKDSLCDAVTALRAVPGSGWKEMADPLAELMDLRRDDGELH